MSQERVLEEAEMKYNSIPDSNKIKTTVVWRNVILFSLLHIGALCGAYLFIFKAMWKTSFFAIFLYMCAGIGITAGAHRLWAHKSYKARLPLRILLVIFETLGFMNSVFEWSRDHRMHHKYSDTDADPHNAARGFFFSHIGWLLVRKHPQIKAMAHTIDISDLWADPVLRFQHKHYKPLVVFTCFLLPTYIPTLWGEDVWTAFFVCALFRYTCMLHVTWCINSAAHMWGNKPYDKTIRPVQTNFLSFVALGEGYHNYHHTFPWDYKSAELGYCSLSFTTFFLDCMAKIGWAYDQKTVSEDVIKNQVMKTGDGSHSVWGWDDKDLSDTAKKAALIMN